MNCPACDKKLNDVTKGFTIQKILQHHFWGTHGIDVIRSHELARKADEGQLTEEDVAELKQMRLAL